jgi:hypothetical protein
MNKELSFITCQRRLPLVWMGYSLALILLLVAQSVHGPYGSRVDRAWQWLIPLVLPTVSLIVGAVAYEAKSRGEGRKISRFPYRVALFLSLLYLTLVLSVPLLAPLTADSPINFMQESTLWLAPVQGLASIALGVFFGARGK